MTESPALSTYRSDDAPERERWAARWPSLPMIFLGRTKEVVVAAAEAFWTAEQAKEAGKRKAAADRAERNSAMRGKRA